MKYKLKPIHTAVDKYNTRFRHYNRMFQDFSKKTSLEATNEGSSSSTEKQSLQAIKKFNPFPNYTDYAYIPPGFMLPLHITLTFLFAKGLLLGSTQDLFM